MAIKIASYSMILLIIIQIQQLEPAVVKHVQIQQVYKLLDNSIKPSIVLTNYFSFPAEKIDLDAAGTLSYRAGMSIFASMTAVLFTMLLALLVCICLFHRRKTNGTCIFCAV